jgi:hypothetical protein
MTDEPYYICATCGERIEADAPDTVRAVKMEKFVTMGNVEWQEGMGALFHEHCYPTGSQHYRRKP